MFLDVNNYKWASIYLAVTFVSVREVKASRGKVISDKDLEILLDRSDLLGKQSINNK